MKSKAMSKVNPVDIDFSRVKGAVKPMHCVNNGPIDMSVRGISNFGLFSEAGIPYTRLHDSAFDVRYGGDHSVDVHRIFRDFNADETDPLSYKFEATDSYLASLIKAGTKPFYRLGASIEHYQKDGTYPPKDYEKWARVCEHIVRHYNEGWANGFRYNIVYWEIWNEADLYSSNGSNPCWQGTEDDFVEFFTAVARHLKNCFPHLKIGGPAFSSPWKFEFNKKIFESLKQNQVSLDFFSFHGYCRKPSQYTELIEAAKKQLDDFGFSRTEIILNEWNYVRGWRSDDWIYTVRACKSLKGASFISGAMCVAQKSCLDMFMYYDARPSALNGMFDTDFLFPLKGYYPFRMYNVLYRMGMFVDTVSDSEDIYVLAAKGEKSFAVMMTYFDDVEEASVKEVKINLKGLGRKQNLKIEFFLLDHDHNMTCVRSELLSKDDSELFISLKLFDSYLILMTST